MASAIIGLSSYGLDALIISAARFNVARAYPNIEGDRDRPVFPPMAGKYFFRPGEMYAYANVCRARKQARESAFPEYPVVRWIVRDRFAPIDLTRSPSDGIYV